MSNSLDFLEGLSPTPASYHAAVRRLRQAEALPLRPLRVAVAASFTAEPLGNYLVVEGARRGFDIHPWFAPYNQFELQCSTPGSALFAHGPEVVVLALRLEELVPELWSEYEALSEADRERLAAEACDRIREAAAGVRRHSSASVVLFNFTEPARISTGLVRSPAGVVAYANQRLERIGEEQRGVLVFDFARLALEMGLQQIFDARLDYVSRMPFRIEAQIRMAGRLARFLRAVHTGPAKCLVLDLDNTLWGGVLGEVGPGGIALGNDYPGRVFADFQRSVRALRQRGILLAIASKNNENEVLEVLERHPDMVLRRDDFAAVEIHWRDKAESLRAIAGRLGIGLDALAFYDDNPLEREWVRGRIPEVTVIEVPDDVLRRAAALEECEVFDQVTVSAEDRERAALYQRERQREEIRAESTSLEAFLEKLEIRVTVGAVDAATLPRVAQLIHKTNQFNLTSRRYTEAEIGKQLDDGAIACWLRAADRFGDYGLVGAAIALCEGARTWRIDSFVLSCRILGRQVESALLAALAQKAAEAGAETLIGEYVPGPRNAPAQEFYRTHGFEAGGGGRWTWSFARGRIEVPGHLTLEMLRAEGVCG